MSTKLASDRNAGPQHGPIQQSPGQDRELPTFRNGTLLLRGSENGVPITSELVKELEEEFFWSEFEAKSAAER